MGRPPSNGGPAFRFTHNEVAEMEAILRENDNQVPGREVLAALSDKFSQSAERASGGKLPVQVKQVWNWFQNRRYALRSKMVKAPGKLATSSMPVEDAASVRSMPHGLKIQPTQAGHIGRVVSENSQMEFEAKSARDGAWYDVQMFLSHRFFESGDPEVLVRFAGFGPEEDEWVNVRKHVRQRSLPCESTECIAVLQGDLVLSFQEGKEQALYFDAHVLDAQRRRHDVRGCRCRFLVRYDHDQSEEIVPLRKICRRPETDYRMQQLNMAKNMPTTATTEPQKFVVSNPNPGSTILKPPANHPNVAVQTYQKITVNPNSAGVPVSVQTSMGVSPVNVIPELQKVGSGNPMVSSEISGNKATIVSMGMPSEMAKQ